MADIDVVGLRTAHTGLHELVHTSDGKTLFVRCCDPKSEFDVRFERIANYEPLWNISSIGTNA
jgi:hypothetical protein